MNIILSFAPLIVFPIVAGLYTANAGLWAAFGAAVIVAAVDARSSHGSIKLLNLGTVLLFAALAFVGMLFHPAWNGLWVRLVINAGLLAIVVYTIVSGRPFTLQYAREQVPKEFWDAPIFIATNYRISWVWAGAFAVSVALNLIRIYAPSLPPGFNTTVAIAVLVGAAWFTAWYPKRVRAANTQRAPVEEKM